MTNGWLRPARHLVLQTLTDPRAAARRVIGFGMSYMEALAATAVVASTAMILSSLIFLTRGPGPNEAANAMMSAPVLGALSYLGMTAGLAAVAVGVGRLFGGTGDFAAGLVLFAWFQAMTVILQVVQLVLSLALPAMALFSGLLLLGWMPWALAQFICVLHGFRSVLKVMGLGAISLVGVLFLLAILLTIAGVTLPGAS